MDEATVGGIAVSPDHKCPHGNTFKWECQHCYRDLEQRLLNETWGHCDFHRQNWKGLSEFVASIQEDDDGCVGCVLADLIETIRSIQL